MGNTFDKLNRIIETKTALSSVLVNHDQNVPSTFYGYAQAFENALTSGGGGSLTPEQSAFISVLTDGGQPNYDQSLTAVNFDLHNYPALTSLNSIGITNFLLGNRFQENGYDVKTHLNVFNSYEIGDGTQAVLTSSMGDGTSLEMLTLVSDNGLSVKNNAFNQCFNSRQGGMMDPQNSLSITSKNNIEIGEYAFQSNKISYINLSSISGDILLNRGCFSPGMQQLNLQTFEIQAPSGNVLLGEDLFAGDSSGGMLTGMNFNIGGSLSIGENVFGGASSGSQMQFTARNIYMKAPNGHPEQSMGGTAYSFDVTLTAFNELCILEHGFYNVSMGSQFYAPSVYVCPHAASRNAQLTGSISLTGQDLVVIGNEAFMDDDGSGTLTSTTTTNIQIASDGQIKIGDHAFDQLMGYMDQSPNIQLTSINSEQTNLEIEIGDYAFSQVNGGNFSLMVYSNAVKKIGNYAFWENRSSYGWYVPTELFSNKLESIGNYAFDSTSDMSQYSTINLEQCTTLSSIGERAFNNFWFCNNLYLPATNDGFTIGPYAFGNLGNSVTSEWSTPEVNVYMRGLSKSEIKSMANYDTWFDGHMYDIKIWYGDSGMEYFIYGQVESDILSVMNYGESYDNDNVKMDKGLTLLGNNIQIGESDTLYFQIDRGGTIIDGWPMWSLISVLAENESGKVSISDSDMQNYVWNGGLFYYDDAQRSVKEMMPQGGNLSVVLQKSGTVVSTKEMHVIPPASLSIRSNNQSDGIVSKSDSSLIITDPDERFRSNYNDYSGADYLTCYGNYEGSSYGTSKYLNSYDLNSSTTNSGCIELTSFSDFISGIQDAPYGTQFQLICYIEGNPLTGEFTIQ